MPNIFLDKTDLNLLLSILDKNPTPTDADLKLYAYIKSIKDAYDFRDYNGIPDSQFETETHTTDIEQ